MDTKPGKKVKAAENRHYTPREEAVFQVDVPTVDVARAQTLEIEMDCKKGFSVYIPFPGLFESINGSDQVFLAAPATPLKTDEPELVQTWSTTLTRIDKDNPHKKKDFSYGIYCKDLDNFAVGNSPPKMNLKP